ncbi:LPXTG cell wall anchor domain-containing protein [Microbacterium sp. Marseille-Q6648]|nr:LPXTG cell wall anchor domain-containing protein [Microbacterium sp. Marseille-Q6648]
MTGAPAATTATALAMTGGNDGLAALFSGVLMLLAGIGGLLFARRRTA